MLKKFKNVKKNVNQQCRNRKRYRMQTKNTSRMAPKMQSKLSKYFTSEEIKGMQQSNTRKNISRRFNN